MRKKFNTLTSGVLIKYITFTKEKRTSIKRLSVKFLIEEIILFFVGFLIPMILVVYFLSLKEILISAFTLTTLIIIISLILYAPVKKVYFKQNNDLKIIEYKCESKYRKFYDLKRFDEEIVLYSNSYFKRKNITCNIRKNNNKIFIVASSFIDEFGSFLFYLSDIKEIKSLENNNLLIIFKDKNELELSKNANTYLF